MKLRCFFDGLAYGIRFIAFGSLLLLFIVFCFIFFVKIPIIGLSVGIMYIIGWAFCREDGYIEKVIKKDLNE